MKPVLDQTHGVRPVRGAMAPFSVPPPPRSQTLFGNASARETPVSQAFAVSRPRSEASAEAPHSTTLSRLTALFPHTA